MPVPTHTVATRRLPPIAGLLVFTLLAAVPLFARVQKPSISIPLDSLGFQPLTPEFLAAGSSMLSLDFIDDHHLLLTFNARTLLKRIPGDPPSDQDRNVAALLIELPSGRVLARTQWRFHDRGRYLWNLGHGRFLLRNRDSLTTFAPLANLSTKDPFQQHPLIKVLDRTIGVLFLTPDSDLLTVETKALAPPAASSNPAQSNPAQSNDPDPVQINFYRLFFPGDSASQVIAQSAGAGRSRNFGALDLTAAGYLDTLDQRHHNWAFNFDTFDGKIKELAAFGSTCRPNPRFVSHSEFIAFTCRLGDTPNALAAFNMRGEEMWEQGLYGDFFSPFLVFSPDSGRFALGRVMLNSTFYGADLVKAQDMASQNVTVYQIESGKQIFKVDCSPIERAGQNFALSPSGLSLGVVADDAVEIYALPPLTSKEQAAVKLAQASAPPVSELPVHLASETAPPSDATSAKAETQPTSATGAGTGPGTGPDQSSTQTNSPAAAKAAPAAAPASQTQANAISTPANPPSAPPSAAASPARPSGDPQTEEPRKPPTLYTLPTDTPHNQPDNQTK